MTPTISTSRLILRPLTRATQRQIEWLRNPDVVKYSEQRHREHTLSTQLRYVSSFFGKSHIWGLYLAENGEHIGNMSATTDEPNNVSDIGIMIGEVEMWGKGYAREAWQAACNWLIDPHCGGIRKLQAGCMRTNTAMLRVICSSGFKQEGELLNRFLVNGAPVSALLFGRMR